MNTAYTTVGIAVGANIPFFVSTIIGFGLSVFLYGHRKLYIRICAGLVLLFLLSGICIKYSPSHMLRFYRGGASSLALKDPYSGIDSVSTQVIADLSAIFQSQTIYKGETRTLTDIGQKALNRKMREYTAMCITAKRLQHTFCYFWFFLCLGLFSSALSAFSQKTVFNLLAYTGWAVCGFIILSYPASIVFYSYKLNLLGAFITLGALYLIIGQLLRMRKVPILQ